MVQTIKPGTNHKAYKTMNTNPKNLQKQHGHKHKKLNNNLIYKCLNCLLKMLKVKKCLNCLLKSPP